MKRSFTFNSNAVRLGAGEWGLTFLIIAAVFMFAPAAWEVLEVIEFFPGYRVPYESSNNYWMISRFIKESAVDYPAVVVGDSVIWGHYSGIEGTLTGHLNRVYGGEFFANLGIDGLHPAAMRGLLDYYGGALKDGTVILHLNLLWMSSARHDLRVQEEFRFNHPRLVPQVFPGIECYRPSLSEIAGIAGERSIPFLSMARHIRQNYFDNMDLLNWTLMNPRENPFSAIDFRVPDPSEGPRSRSVSWQEAGIRGEQDIPWVGKTESLQWEYFKKTLSLLRKRGNEVVVVIGPFNTHLLTEGSAGRYETLLRDVEGWLRENTVPCHVFSTLPPGYFADASHPLDEGYLLLAEELKNSPALRAAGLFD